MESLNEGVRRLRRFAEKQRVDRLRRMEEATPKLEARAKALDTEVGYLEAKAKLAEKQRKIRELKERIGG